ncbi:MAG TPA: hypothetical protein VEY06_10540, partial [Flavisolibacter sp.]|nr:hypothetical protein [Flavisolibacter sp.]
VIIILAAKVRKTYEKNRLPVALKDTGRGTPAAERTKRLVRSLWNSQRLKTREGLRIKLHFLVFNM